MNNSRTYMYPNHRIFHGSMKDAEEVLAQVVGVYGPGARIVNPAWDGIIGIVWEDGPEGWAEEMQGHYDRWGGVYCEAATGQILNVHHICAPEDLPF